MLNLPFLLDKKKKTILRRPDGFFLRQSKTFISLYKNVYAYRFLFF